MSVPHPARREDITAEAAANLLHRLHLKNVAVAAGADGWSLDVDDPDDGRLSDADVAELRRLKWAVLRLLGLVELL